MKLKKEAFTLTEMIIVVLITSIGMALFSVVFFSSWKNYEINLRHINLKQQIDSAFRVMSEDIMEAKSSNISADELSLILQYPTAHPLISVTNPFSGTIVYSITPSGVVRSVGGVSQSLISMAVDISNNRSRFKGVGSGIACNLKLDDFVFGHTVSQQGNITVVPRNN